MLDKFLILANLFSILSRPKPLVIESSAFLAAALISLSNLSFKWSMCYSALSN